MVQGRQTAYKVWLADLLQGVYYREEGEWDPNYVLVRNMKISRVNIIATVVDKYVGEGLGHASLEIDDGSSKIQVKAWKNDVGLIDHVNLGDLILFIGRAREFNGILYLTPEIVKVLPTILWGKLRKLELLRLYGKPFIKDPDKGNSFGLLESPHAELEVTHSTRKKILDIIGSADEVSYDMLISQSGLPEDEIENVVKELIKEGEVYMPRPNYLRCI